MTIVQIDPSSLTDYQHRLITRIVDALRPDPVRLVGGFIRDNLLGVPVQDIDFATPLLPEEVMERLHKADIRVVPTGLSHGTVSAIVDNKAYEITTLRRDIVSDGRHAKVVYTDDWQEDAQRRDFTINALFADPVSFEVYDYFDGLADLKESKVRFIGSAEKRIAEDYLRILRFFRFSARFCNGPYDLEALRACHRQRHGMQRLSGERVREELMSIFRMEKITACCQQMVDYGIVQELFPAMQEVALSILNGLLRLERALAISVCPLRRLGSIIPHDSPDVFPAIAERLKFSNKDRGRWHALMTDREKEGLPSEQQLSGLVFEQGYDRVQNWLLYHAVWQENGDFIHLLRCLEKYRNWSPPSFPIKGGDLIARGLPAGPKVGKTLAAIRSEWIARQFPLDDKTLDRMIASHLPHKKEGG